MPLNNPGSFLARGRFSARFSAFAAIAVLTVAAPPFLGAAFAQSYFPPPGGDVEVYPAPPRAMGVYPPPRDAEDVYPSPREDVEVDRPSHQAVDVNRLPRDAVDVPAQQISGTTTPVSAVSMRAGPNTGTPVIGTLHPGMPLQLLATANHGWMQVQSSAGTGWVYGSYLASGTGAAVATNASAPAPMPAYGNSTPSAAGNQPATGNARPPAVSNQPPPEITSP